MTWTTEGTIAVENGSTSIVGTGTAWLTDGLMRAGDTLVLGGELYEIGGAAVSNTEAELADPFPGSTASGLSYKIIHTGLLPSELAKAVAELQERYLTTVTQLLGWETATSGTVPITNPATGETVNVRPLQVAAETTSVWRYGAGAPSAGIGDDGDYYVRTTNGDVYYKAAGAYSVVANIKGPQGDAGNDGTNGAAWRNGGGVPSDATGANGDYWFDTTSCDVYRKTSGTYSVVANIRGAAGVNSGGSVPGFFPGSTSSIAGGQQLRFEFDITLKKLSVWAGDPVPSNTTVTIKKNGVAVASATIVTGGTSATSGTLSIAITTADYITADLSSAGASNVGFRLDFI